VVQVNTGARYKRLTGAHDGATRDDGALHRAGGISALLLAIGYVLIIPLYVLTGAPPTGAAARLASLDGKTTVWWCITGLSVLTDLLFIPVAVAVYAALAPYGRRLALFGAALLLLFVVLDLAITWPNYALLIALSGPYAAATSDAQRAVYLAAATYASGVLESTLAGVYAIGVPSLGILLIGLAMRTARFGWIAYLGVVTGAFGIAAVAGSMFTTALNTLAVATSALTTIWLFAVGYKLYRLRGA
jgi:hypothetical protein